MLICNKPKIFDVDLYGLAAALGIFALSWIFFIQPLEKKCAQRLQDQQQYQQSTQAAQNELTQLQKLVRHQQVLSAQVSQARDLLKDNTGMANVIRKIASLTQSSGLRLDEITPGDQTRTNLFHKTELKLKLQGSFPQLRSFLIDLAQNLPYVPIDALELTNKGDSETAFCDVAMDLHVFAPK